MKNSILIYILLLLSITFSYPTSTHAQPLSLQNNLDIIETHSVSKPIPSIGSQKALAILVDFSDAPGIYTQASFSSLFFSQTGASLATYFYENSYGALHYTGDVVGISSGNPITNSSSISYVRLPNPKSYYTKSNRGNDLSDFPRNFAGVYYHAVQALEQSGFNFAPYSNSQGELENVIVVFAGYSTVASSNPNDFQPTAYSLDVFLSGGGYASNGYLFNNFTFCPEQDSNGQATIGVCVHEHGHNLGLPDFYDFSYTTTGIGYFDLMAYGLYGDPTARRPFHLSAFSKIKLGWITPITPSSNSSTITLRPIEDSPDVLKLAPSSTSKEYFLIENRQGKNFNDGFEAAGLCKGLLIWHVDEDIYSTYLSSNLVNTIPASGGPSHFGLSLIEQDGQKELGSAPINYGECEDSYTINNTWSDTSPGNSKYWNGSASGFSLTVLSQQNDGSITIQLGESTAPSSSSIKIRAGKGKLSGFYSSSSTIENQKAELLRSPSLKRYKRTTTDSSGAFKFTRIKTGKYIVRIGTTLSKTFKVK